MTLNTKTEQKSSKHKSNVWFRTSMGVQSKFLLGTGLILLCVCLASAFVIYFHEKQQMEERAYAQSDLVMSAVDASRDYVREVLRPAMYREFGHDHFIPEAMSTSFVGRSVMERFAPSLEKFKYRRVAVNARNPDFEATPLEREKINFFETNPDQMEWRGVLNSEGHEQFMRFRPVVFEHECMSCHGDPRDAPEVLLTMYGSDRGFGREVGQLAGVSMVSVPVEAAMSEVREKAISVFLVVFLGVSIVFIALSFFFNRMVVTNLRGLMGIFRDESDQHPASLAHIPESNWERMDELEGLTIAASTMADHLSRTREKLRQYAQDLEKKVEERTLALRESQGKLQQQVSARNQELQTLNALAELTTQAVNLSEILPQVLQRTMRVFPARGAGIYLYEENKNRLVLHYQESALGLMSEISFGKSDRPVAPAEPSTLKESIIQAARGQASFFHCRQNLACLNLPLYCRGRVLGVMAFIGVQISELSGELQSLLSSIGRQIGIAVESLQNMEKLMQSKDLLQSVFDGITDQVVFMDREFRIKMVNKAYTTGYNVEMEELIGRRCYDIHGSGERPCPDCGLKEVIRTRKAVIHERSCPSSHGIFQVHCYPTLDEQGRVENIIRYVKEITNQKQMEQKIQQTEKLVAMGQLAAGVAHEINNPLGVILCYVELLKRQANESSQTRDDLSIIEKQAQSCKRIVSDLLQFARSRESRKQTASINETLNSVLDIVTEQFRKQGMKIELDLSPDLPLLNMDIQKMKQVFLNLLMNASQAMQDGRGKLRVNTKYLPEKKSVEVLLWDNGQGIPEYLMDKIFDPFFSTKRTGEGTGLGLSLSYGIIREHDGDISVSSKHGEWTEFRILLPVDDGQEATFQSVNPDSGHA